MIYNMMHWMRNVYNRYFSTCGEIPQNLDTSCRVLSAYSHQHFRRTIFCLYSLSLSVLLLLCFTAIDVLLHAKIAKGKENYLHFFR